METLTTGADPAAGPDVNVRLNLAQDPATESQALWQLIDDANDLVANTARTRLGLTRRPTYEPHVVHIPVIDTVTGRLVA
ncbi:hypothetical protein [Arthrobacter sp. UYCo732]|uniref:hypothetical protein n=1 Tax=Arthrobacter sp. UYCo732 TaxID=3156336 RepID=UPI003392C023